MALNAEKNSFEAFLGRIRTYIHLMNFLGGLKIEKIFFIKIFSCSTFARVDERFKGLLAI
ncbi:hypothetical protein [Prochlorococcus sp. MIT 1300]|uniref:hypothetical protein n=1 Tax=Prochlorococcus sp. MIT 1300 TaxID=3096218 RepID=UPI002A74E857|nr:hypothetical protein [Prochlorococcus sp. MIT 1300]